MDEEKKYSVHVMLSTPEKGGLFLPNNDFLDSFCERYNAEHVQSGIYHVSGRGIIGLDFEVPEGQIIDEKGIRAVLKKSGVGGKRFRGFAAPDELLSPRDAYKKRDHEMRKGERNLGSFIGASFS